MKSTFKNERDIFIEIFKIAEERSSGVNRIKLKIIVVEDISEEIIQNGMEGVVKR